MVGELNNQNENRNVVVDLGSLGDALNQEVGVNKEDKILIDEETEGLVIACDLHRDDSFKYNKDDPTKKYYPCRAIVQVEFVGKDGEKHITKDRYAGLRLYPKFDQNGNVVYLPNGAPDVERFWANSPNSNRTSDFSKLLGKLTDYTMNLDPDQDFAGPMTYRKLFACLGSGTIKCMIKKEQRAFGGEITEKNVIQKFIK